MTKVGEWANQSVCLTNTDRSNNRLSVETNSVMQLTYTVVSDVAHQDLII